jgi:hypothetical protein
MTRALSLSCLALLVLSGTAWAGKPSIAVLGLEVVDPSGTPTPADTQVAKELTEGLRSRAKAGSGPYSLAPASDKELIDEKLLNSCDSEAASCMSAIALSINADVLMYGKIEKQGKEYKVTLKLLDARRKLVEKSSNDLIPVGQASGASLQSQAKSIYGKLTGQQTSGMLVVKLSNAERGTILVDGEAKGNINNGVGQVSGLEEGRYKLAVESEGFHRWEQDITVRAGETQNIPVKLDKVERDDGEVMGVGPGGTGPNGPGEGGGGRRGGDSSGWRKVLYGSIALGVAGGAVWIAGWHTVNSAHDRVCAIGGYVGMNADCSSPPTYYAPQSDVDHENSRGDLGHTMSVVGVSMVIGAVVGGGLSIVMMKHHGSSSSSSEHAMRGHRVRRDPLVVTPIVSPNAGGATLQFSW